MMSIMVQYAVVVLLWVLCARDVVARPGAYEVVVQQRVNGVIMDIPASHVPVCYRFSSDGHGQRALTRYAAPSWYVQIDVRYATMFTCDGYAWAQVVSSTIVLDVARLHSVVVHDDIARLPHDVDATVCRMVARTGVSYCYAPVISIDADDEGAAWWVNITDGWYVTTVRVDGVRYDEYTFLTRTPDGSVITDPASPEEFTPLCYSFDGLGNGTQALVRWEFSDSTWRILIDERYSFALTCLDRQWGIIEDADRGMPGAVLIMAVSGMQTMQIHQDADAQPIEVSATACYVDRYHGTFCYESEVWIEITPQGVVEWYTNLNDGWTLTVYTSQPASGSVTAP